jgi:hypothetical protein
MRESKGSDIFTSYLTDMKRISNYFKLAIIAFVISASAISCSNDEFFMLNCTDSPLDIKTIANSFEYREYLNEYYRCLNSALETDTSQMELVDDLGTHLIYCKIETCDFSGVISKLKELEHSYPEFASATPLEQKSVMDYAIANDDNLRKEIGIKAKPFKRTRSGNYEDAFVSMMCYSFNGYFFFREDTRIELGTSAYAKCAAATFTMAKGVEHGGYGWSDGSGVVLYDPHATSNSMRMLSTFNSPMPDYSFHIHPSGNLSPSNKDKSYWIGSGIEKHLILNTSLGCKTYKVIGSQIVEQ